jgi:hypothetical protein
LSWLPLTRNSRISSSVRFCFDLVGISCSLNSFGLLNCLVAEVYVDRPLLVVDEIGYIPFAPEAANPMFSPVGNFRPAQVGHFSTGLDTMPSRVGVTLG